MSLDPVALAQDLIRRPSVTPADEGAMDVLQQALESAGFACRRMRFGEIENLYARRGTAAPNLCFAGHTDVVPVGDAGAWLKPPFAGVVEEGVLYGRGAVDMKGAIAAFAAAASEAQVPGSLSFLITGDEEGAAEDGTARLVEALAAEGERIDHVVLGEPTSSSRLGDQIKIGRRGSLNAWITVDGAQGHVAYPQQAANPIPPLVRLLARLQGRVLDEGHPGFQPSNLEVTTIDVGNPATNVIPAQAKARLNIRFNPAHDGQGLIDWLIAECAAEQAGFSGKVGLVAKLTGNAFLTEPGPFVEVCAQAVEEVLGRRPELSTTGGISDARFIRKLCPVVELGLVNATMHAVDECTPVEHIADLTRVYAALIARYFTAFG
ncbi:succinyl-diaminopimelate desuccinylase [Phenylobacterium montanum]|uniref:Succinyl-diaminopimelate desuccinylase n=1 Tax=Phenylobacterium montanum TaxID=2823693 RepID=A0A975ITD2_9CAUL|nr:succinyl-diaminopimelate desuccinylase [Caulobacter sp. S6]QUD86610.1 succinyl-diaminopimelate desuccinylase [Caulobacter sp. S6]